MDQIKLKDVTTQPMDGRLWRVHLKSEQPCDNINLKLDEWASLAKASQTIGLDIILMIACFFWSVKKVDT